MSAEELLQMLLSRLDRIEDQVAKLQRDVEQIQKDLGPEYGSYKN